MFFSCCFSLNEHKEKSYSTIFIYMHHNNYTEINSDDANWIRVLNQLIKVDRLNRPFLGNLKANKKALKHWNDYIYNSASF